MLLILLARPSLVRHRPLLVGHFCLSFFHKKSDDGSEELPCKVSHGDDEEAIQRGQPAHRERTRKRALGKWGCRLIVEWRLLC
ncbi:MAG: hypothetical protein GWP91_12320 [Rhodobacterales bacterium]|nr:hypothetical protein [Rhodobacterales bacterium]